MVRFSMWCDQCDTRTTEFQIGENNSIECSCGNTLIWGDIIRSDSKKRIELAKAIWGL